MGFSSDRIKGKDNRDFSITLKADGWVNTTLAANTASSNIVMTTDNYNIERNENPAANDHQFTGTSFVSDAVLWTSGNAGFSLFDDDGNEIASKFVADGSEVLAGPQGGNGPTCWTYTMPDGNYLLYIVFLHGFMPAARSIICLYNSSWVKQWERYTEVWTTGGVISTLAYPYMDATYYYYWSSNFRKCRINKQSGVMDADPSEVYVRPSTTAADNMKILPIGFRSSLTTHVSSLLSYSKTNPKTKAEFYCYTTNVAARFDGVEFQSTPLTTNFGDEVGNYGLGWWNYHTYGDYIHVPCVHLYDDPTGHWIIASIEPGTTTVEYSSTGIHQMVKLYQPNTRTWTEGEIGYTSNQHNPYLYHLYDEIYVFYTLAAPFNGLVHSIVIIDLSTNRVLESGEIEGFPAIKNISWDDRGYLRISSTSHVMNVGGFEKVRTSTALPSLDDRTTDNLIITTRPSSTPWELDVIDPVTDAPNVQLRTKTVVDRTSPAVAFTDIADTRMPTTLVDWTDPQFNYRKAILS